VKFRSFATRENVKTFK